MTSSWDNFVPYMTEVYGAAVFEQGFEIVKQYQEQGFDEIDGVTMQQALSNLFPDKRVSKDFETLCLMQLVTEPTAFVTNLTEEN